MMSRTTKAVAIAAAVVVAIATLLWITTPDSYGGNDPGRITRWDTTGGHSSPVLRPVGNVAVPARARLTRWHTHATRGHRGRVPAGSDICNGRGGYVVHYRVRLVGGNALVNDVVEANMRMTSCYWQGDIRSTTVSVDGGGRFLWEFQGVQSMVKGGGINGSGIEYRYRRAYFKWNRSFDGVGQNQTAWTAMTVRGDGTCTFDKYRQAGTGEC